MNGEHNTNPLYSRQSRKRPHVEIDDSDSNDQGGGYSWRAGEPSSSGGNYHASSPPGGAPLSLPPLPQMRLPGYDYRRPAMASGASRTSLLPSQPPTPPPPPQPNNVIDLTEDSPPQPERRTQRPPRFGRNIMADVVDLEEEQRPSRQQQPSSPEVQFLGATPRTLEPEIQGSTRYRSGLYIPTVADGPSNFFELLQQATRESRLRRAVEQQTRGLAFLQQTLGRFWLGGTPGNGVDLTIDLDEDNPVELNYMSTTSRPSRPTADPPYVAPPPAPEGFTRTLKEDEVAVCPNCDCELGISDDPLKRQIWVAKPCGHVYCGLCAKNRALSRSKRQERTRDFSTSKPFSKCVVPGCEKPVSQPKAMFQLYL